MTEVGCKVRGRSRFGGLASGAWTRVGTAGDMRSLPVRRWTPWVVTLAAVGALWWGFPETRHVWNAPRVPWATVGLFTLGYVTWTGLRGVRYWLLLGGPAGLGLPVVSIAYVHHAAIDFLPFRSGVLTYPVLTRFLTGLRWRRILESMVGASLGDALATALYLTWVLPPEVSLVMGALVGLAVGLGIGAGRALRAWFRRRHPMSRVRFRFGWWAGLGLSLVFPRRTLRRWGLWAILSVVIVTLKYVGLTLLYHGWAAVYGETPVSTPRLFQALVAAELSRELPFPSWLHLGTWELAWLAVAGGASQAPVALVTHVTYEFVVLLSALPAAVYMTRRWVRRPGPGRPGITSAG